MSKPMYSGIAGKVALVTGGGRGLGKAICLALAREGADVALTDLQSADETAKEVEALGQKAMAFSADVTKEAEVTKMADRIVAAWGGIDIYPEDQADAVVFLASERARMVTGTTLLVDGGISLPVGYVEWDDFYSSRKQWLKEKKWEGKRTSM